MNADQPRALTVHHIPVCPFSQRLEILLALKEQSESVRFAVVDITCPRDPELLAKTGGSTALPVLEFADGTVLKESLVILQYLEDLWPQTPVARSDPGERELELTMTRLEGDFVGTGYRFVLNQDRSMRAAWHEAMLAEYAKLNDFLLAHSPQGVYLFDRFGWAEAVFTPMFMRFAFLEYYEGFVLPDAPSHARVRRWVKACLAHPAAQQVSREEVVKLYYDYAKGAGNGALLPGRARSSFVFEPHWGQRPWPPTDKYAHSASDHELGLLP